MKIEIITTGDEVLNGVIIDTNSAWIADHCVKLGHEIVRHTTVGDYMDDIRNALKAAAQRADAVMVSGGLGPTADDITIEAASKAFGSKLVKNEKALDDIRAFFKRVGRPCSPSNDKQALIPHGGIVLPNRVGTAPGVRVKFDRAWFFFLPGVPAELYQIFKDSIIPWLREHSDSHIEERVLRCFGIPEASIDEKLKGVNLGETRLSFRVKFPEILLKVFCRSKDANKAVTEVEKATAAIRERLGDIVYASADETMPMLIGRLLAEKGMTIAVAESCTGGYIASEITNISGSSRYFERGFVTYSNVSKTEELGVPEEVIKAHGAVSRETALSMASRARKASGSSVAIAVTGIAGPAGGTKEKPIGTVCIALATPDGTDVREFVFSRDRLMFKQLVSWTALDLVRRYLLGK